MKDSRGMGVVVCQHLSCLEIGSHMVHLGLRGVSTVAGVWGRGHGSRDGDVPMKLEM